MVVGLYMMARVKFRSSREIPCTVARARVYSFPKWLCEECARDSVQGVPLKEGGAGGRLKLKTAILDLSPSIEIITKCSVFRV